MNTSFVATCLVLAATTSALSAQQARPSVAPRGPDPMESSFFPPELVMQNQQALNLTDEQRNYFIGEVQRTQSQATAIQWRMTQAMEKLTALVKAPRVDEAQTLAQLDSMLSIEREMKRAQMTLLVRFKNRLTLEQQALLRDRMLRATEPVNLPPR